MNWTNPMRFSAELKRWLGAAPSDPGLDAWASMMTALRDSTEASWQAARASYLGLKRVREDLGLPFYSTPTEGNPDKGGWAPDLDQQAVDLQAMRDVLVLAANDVLNNKRKLVWSEDLQDFVIEALPGDKLAVRVVNGKPVLYDPYFASLAEVHPPGTVGIAPLIIGGAIIGAAIVGGLVAYTIVKESMATMRTFSEQRTIQTLSNNQVSMMEKGATAEQATAATKAVTDGAASIKQAEAEVEKAKASGTGVDQWTNLIKVGGLVALGIGVLYIVAKLVPRGGVRGTPALSPKLSENQRCRVGTKVQTLIFSKTHFTRRGAVAWARQHGYRASKVDEKPNSYRVRQHSPASFGRGSFRTIRLTDGVQAAVGCPR
jgi:hypothetical protein